MKLVGKPDALIGHVRFDERGWETEHGQSASSKPRPSSTLLYPTMDRLLPRGSRVMTPKEINGLQKWFGIDGAFPAVHVETREVRGL